jgi:hypothetical protein
MNACKAIELALKDTIGKYATVGTGVWVCCEQSQTKDEDFEERKKAGRFFPMLHIQASPEGADENGWTFAQPVRLLIGTHAADDPFCQFRADVYEAVRGLVDDLYYETLDSSLEQTELVYLTAQFASYLNGGTINIGGITLPGCPPPGLVGEIQTMQIDMVLHWSNGNP